MRVLVVEDEEELAAKLARALGAAGFAVDLAHDGERADFLGRSEPYDAVVLDLGLPRRDGLSVLRDWRAEGVGAPVLILTARGRWSEKQAGFEAGADDYLVKPFELGEAVLRVQALVRRSRGHAAPEIACGALRLDTHRGSISLDGEPVSLTAQEYRLVVYLMHHAERVVSRSELLDHVYERGLDPDSNVIDVLIGRVRRKIGAERIETVRARGFRLRPLPP
ncbi:response regulator transcription factor [Myxococcota bacterium]|nr:response regulator transcription factor [Myxococcota bacterium]MCZ7620467.1 response regulator transcription factor [Myxococcota bacterium]